MDDNKDFIQELTLLFWKHGAKSLTMDDIAKEFSMSKKTLYQQYENKEQILKEVLNYVLSSMVKGIRAAKSRFENPIEAFMQSNADMEIFISESDNIFILQMNKYYRDILQEHQKVVYSELVEVFSSNIERGRELGFYRKDFDQRVYFKFLLQLFFSVEDSPLFEDERDHQGQLCNGILDFYLNSILTEKGLKNYNLLKTKYEELA